MEQLLEGIGVSDYGAISDRYPAASILREFPSKHFLGLKGPRQFGGGHGLPPLALAQR